MRITSATDSVFQRHGATLAERQWNDDQYKSKLYGPNFDTPHPTAQKKLDTAGWVAVPTKIGSEYWPGGYIRRAPGGELQLLHIMGRSGIDPAIEHGGEESRPAEGHEWKITSMTDGGFGHKWFNPKSSLSSIVDWIDQNPDRYDEVSSKPWPAVDNENAQKWWLHARDLYQQAKAARA